MLLTQSCVSLPSSYSKREDAIVFSVDSHFFSATELKPFFPSTPSFILPSECSWLTQSYGCAFARSHAFKFVSFSTGSPLIDWLMQSTQRGACVCFWRLHTWVRHQLNSWEPVCLCLVFMRSVQDSRSYRGGLDEESDFFALEINGHAPFPSNGKLETATATVHFSRRSFLERQPITFCAWS